MKKILLILLIVPFFAFAIDVQNLSDKEIKEKIVGKWSSSKIGRQANTLTYYDNGTVSFKTYACDNNTKKALYAGEQISQYKIEDGYIYVGQFIEDGFVNKLKVVSMKAPTLRLVYDMPGYPYDKMEINYLKTTNMVFLPLCQSNREKLSKPDDKSQLQTDLDLLQDKLIEKFKEVLVLPKDLDEYTILQDIYKSNNELFYKLRLKNATKDGFNDQVFRSLFRILAVNNYCEMNKSTNKLLKNLRLIFPTGATFIYSFEDEEPFFIHVDSSSCPKQ